MSNMKKRSIFMILIVLSLFVGGCKYDFILPDYVPPVKSGVSFSNQVATIFSTGNKCIECHKPGGQTPDLTAGNAYSQLGSKYINTSSPETSLLLTHPGSSTHTQRALTASEAAIILTWIKEGAKNN